MFDINFYIKIFKLKQKLMNLEFKGGSRDNLFKELEKIRSKKPVIYNIETSNACNMRCEMCPRTTMMTRQVSTMDMPTFKKIIDQIEPFSEAQWQEWEEFAANNYGIKKDDMSENHFFLYIIPKVLVLHGYGDPLLDRYMPERIKLLTEGNIPSYFSCNPANIDIEKSEEMFKNGLGYIKYSIESVDDSRHQEVRGDRSNFSESYNKILKLLEIIKANKYRVKVIITMLNLNKPWQEEEFQKLQKVFKDKDVYVYLKSQDQQWYKNNRQQTKSIHWLEFCQFPWSSMTIKSNGEAVECVEDYNNEIILGDVKKEPLRDIWNGEKYFKFRKDHFNLTRGMKCSEQCDMRLIGSLI